MSHCGVVLVLMLRPVAQPLRNGVGVIYAVDSLGRAVSLTVTTRNAPSHNNYRHNHNHSAVWQGPPVHPSVAHHYHQIHNPPYPPHYYQHQDAQWHPPHYPHASHMHPFAGHPPHHPAVPEAASTASTTATATATALSPSSPSTSSASQATTQAALTASNEVSNADGQVTGSPSPAPAPASAAYPQKSFRHWNYNYSNNNNMNNASNNNFYNHSHHQHHHHHHHGHSHNPPRVVGYTYAQQLREAAMRREQAKAGTTTTASTSAPLPAAFSTATTTTTTTSSHSTTVSTSSTSSTLTHSQAQSPSTASSSSFGVPFSRFATTTSSGATSSSSRFAKTFPLDPVALANSAASTCGPITNPHEVDVVIYHSNCVDGMGACMSAYMKLGLAATYIPGRFNTPPPNLKGKRVVLLDFSYRAADMERIRNEARGLLVLDHHVSAERELSSLPANLKNFDMKKSGAMLAWEFFHPGRPVPEFIQYIEDRDLWRNSLPYSKEVAHALHQEPMTMEHYAGLCLAGESAIERLKAQGKDILAYNDMVVDALCETAVLCVFKPTGQKAWVVNSSVLRSDIGSKLSTSPHADFVMIWSKDPVRGVHICSLRSSATFIADGDVARMEQPRVNVADVSVVASKMGGGGHKLAASFTYFTEDLSALLEPLQGPDAMMILSPSNAAAAAAAASASSTNASTSASATSTSTSSTSALSTSASASTTASAEADTTNSSTISKTFAFSATATYRMARDLVYAASASSASTSSNVSTSASLSAVATKAIEILRSSLCNQMLTMPNLEELTLGTTLSTTLSTTGAATVATSPATT